MKALALAHAGRTKEGGGLCRGCYDKGERFDSKCKEVMRNHAQEESPNAPLQGAKGTLEELGDTLLVYRGSPASLSTQTSQISSQEHLLPSQLASHPEMGAVPDLSSSDSMESGPPARLRDRSSESNFSSLEQEASHLEVVVQIEQQPHGEKRPSETPQESLMAAPRPKNPRLRDTFNDTAARNLVQNMQATMNEAGFTPNNRPRNSGG
ncbi:uncharacterized protein LOC129794485 [Lutzomyia longipalpis]|uniref:uncharacterized protein LOC129794485 n=1 Tax=Lutzomyia longipalpis TaxID=7200 RepID=UPI002483FE5B|nr:uncharacterized protein LOC129794485 [Lutzomyia longipalpis]